MNNYNDDKTVYKSHTPIVAPKLTKKQARKKNRRGAAVSASSGNYSRDVEKGDTVERRFYNWAGVRVARASVPKEKKYL